MADEASADNSVHEPTAANDTAKAKKTPEAPKRTERLSINVSATTASLLRSMAKEKITTITEIVRRAVAILNLLESEQKAGAKIQLVRTDEKGNKVVVVIKLI